MKTYHKCILGVLVLIPILYLGDKAYKYLYDRFGSTARLHTELVNLTEKYEQLTEYSAKLENQYIEAKELQKKAEAQFQAELGSLNGRLKVLSNATFLIREAARKSGKSDLVYSGDRIKYVVNEIRFENGPPVGYVLIFDDGRVVSKLYNHAIDVQTLIARDEDSGKYEIVSKADFILKSPSINVNGEKNWLNKRHPLKITGGVAYIDPTEKNQLTPRFHLWAPHINGGFSAGAGSDGGFLRPTLDVSFAGHGVTKNDLNWKFLHLGFDVDTELEKPGVHLIPFSYRFWPSVLTNTYVGPGVGWTEDGINGQFNINLTF